MHFFQSVLKVRLLKSIAMDNFLFIFSLLVVLIAAVYLYIQKKFSYWKDRGVHFAQPSFPLGNIPLRKIHFKDVFERIYSQKDGSPFVGGYLFTTPVVVPTDLDFLQHILIKDFNSFHERGMYVNEADDPLSAHLFALDGERWRSLRTQLTPTFTSGKMKFMFPTVVDVAGRLQGVLNGFIDSGQEFELKDFLSRFTTDVIGTCAFGIECNSLADPNSVFRHYGKKETETPNLNPIMMFIAVQYPNLARKLHLKTVSTQGIEFFMNTVRETIEYREKNHIRRNDFMDLLIELKNGRSVDGNDDGKGKRLSLEECAAQAFLFFAAGFDTSSTTMLFALYELAVQPELQEKARQEISDVLAKYDGKLTYEALADMTYMDQIINESLRKHPPVSFLLRQCGRNYKVPNSKIVLEKRTDIFIPVHSIHRDPAVYPDPDTFDPERFAPEQKKSRHPMSFLAFGDGPRNCIGLRFGRMQSKIGLVTMLKDFQFKPSAKTLIPMVYSNDTLGLEPKGGMYLAVERVTKNK